MPDPPKSPVAADGVGGESFFDGVPQQWRTVERHRCGVHVAGSHRPGSRFEDARDQFEHGWSPISPVSSLPGLFGGLGEQFFLESA